MARDKYLMRTINENPSNLNDVLEVRELTYNENTDSLVIKLEDGTIKEFLSSDKVNNIIISEVVKPSVVWKGTSLGIRFGDASEEIDFIDLKGDKGDLGPSLEDFISKIYNMDLNEVLVELANILQERAIRINNISTALSNINVSVDTVDENKVLISKSDTNLPLATLDNGKIYADGFIINKNRR